MSDTYSCNLCGSTTFRSINSRKLMQCAECLSFERTRLMGLYLEKLNLGSDARVLHLAPEKGIYDYLSKRIRPENYVTADYTPSMYRYVENCRFIDLCDMDGWDTNSFDVIIHAHVLEHTPCNIAYTLFHLHRMLKPDGVHFCVIPFVSGAWDETFADIGDTARHDRFGQFDHVRRFGMTDIKQSLGNILRLPVGLDVRNDFPEELLHRHRIPEYCWRGLNASMVLQLKKEDYLLV